MPLLESVLVSAALGALVGSIRQWRDQVEQPQESGLGGVRTYALWAMLGCLGAFTADVTSPVVLAALVAAVGAQLIVTRAGAPEGARHGSTAFVASLLTFLVGGLVYWRQPEGAIVVSAATIVLLGSKPKLHGWTRSWTSDDVRVALQFVAVTGVILPVVPRRAFGPYDAFNPFSTWMMVVLISGVGFAGYAAIRMFGARLGILLTSVFGGIASSTASTLAFSRRSRDANTPAAEFDVAVVVACTMMLPRLWVVAGLVSRPFALELAAPFALMIAPGILWVGWRLLQRRETCADEPAPQLANPLGLSTALKFGALYVIVNFAVKAAAALGWTRSLMPVSFVSGFLDTDAIILSLAHRYAEQEPLRGVVVRCGVLAVGANTLLKIGIVMAVGSRRLRRRTVVALGATALVAVAWLLYPVEFALP